MRRHALLVWRRVALHHYAPLFTVLFLALLFEASAVLQQQTADAGPQGSRISGLFSPHVRDFTVVVPRKVDSEGRHISHSLVHHHDGGHQQRRRRRDTVSPNPPQDAPPVYFALPVPRDSWSNVTEEVVLELWPSTSFFAPRLVLQRPLRSRRHVSYSASLPTTCHFQGHIRGEPKSSVAISTCHGLAGLVRSRQRGELWVEPAKGAVDGDTDSDGRQFHIVYRRSASLNPGKKRRKKKRSHEKNCGTREPRRVVRLLHGGEHGVKGRRKKSHQSKRRQQEGRMRWRRAASSSILNTNAAEWLNDASDEEELAWWEYYHTQELHVHDPGDGFSESLERHVEALVVADRSMLDFHHGYGGTDVETYLLTVMNMVSAFFRDPSIGNRINIIVVKMAFMDEFSQGVDELNVTVNADTTLESFCHWQMKNNHPGDNHVNHHDVAILVTRVDICARADEPCGTLGVAHVAGMCHPSRSCSVNQDNGLAVAHTIAHELGHNFGMVHDSAPLHAGCGSRDGNTLHVMTATFEADTDEIAWSPCSRRAITRFLDQGGGECLRDEPAPPDESQYETPQLPAGAMYDADHQCRLQFNASTSGVCSAPEEICSQLWCVVDGNCATLLRPPADGTHCGWHKWCMNRECIELRDSPAPVHGGWGEWGTWSECSRSCGGGVSSTERECDHPRPAHNGNYCLGRRKRYQVCNTQACPEGERSYRAVQCDDYEDPKNKDMINTKWLPYFDKTSPCALYCTDLEQSVVVEAAHAALDGTPCNISSRDMCIDGRCRRVGCDWRVESGAEEDACGVCKGDGSLCETVSQEFMVHEGTGYTEVTIIPKEARNIRVEEMNNSRTFLGVASVDTDHFYIDGKRWRPQWAGECEVAGSPGTYERWGDRETLTVRGPTNETLRLYVIFHGRYRNFGVHYEYTVRRRSDEAAPEFYWGFSEWSACSITCGIGVQVAQPVCLERLLGQVDEARCLKTPPGRLLRACAMSPCPASWWTGPWQLCPVTCGDSNTMRHRSVLCVRLTSWDDPEEDDVQALPDSECEGYARPPDAEPCPNITFCQPGEHQLVTAEPVTSHTVLHTTRAPFPRIMRRHRKREEAWAREQALVLRGPDTERFIWLTDEWGKCPRQCGGSSRRRSVSCHLASSGHRVSGRHCPKPKPLEHEPCNLRPCEQWVTSRWSACSARCGDSRPGWRARRVECPQPPHCDPSQRPVSAERCSLTDCGSS